MVQKECGPANTSLSDSQPPELRENKLVLFEATQFAVLCYGSPRKLRQHT